MDLFFKICGAVLLISVICLLIEKREKDLTLVLSICTCCCVGICLVSFLQPVLQFVHSLRAVATIDEEVLRIVFKVVAIGLIAEISTLICQDAGKSALGKMLQASATAVILWLSLPLFTRLMDLIRQIMGGL